MSATALVCIQKIDKLIPRLESIVALHYKERWDLRINQIVDDFYYKQKIEELTLLKKGLALRNTGDISTITRQIYSDAFRRWKLEIRAVNKVLLLKSNNLHPT